MQDYEFRSTYSLIALNWCIGYLSDEELVTFLKKCKAGLGENKYPNGCLIVLDNEPDAMIEPGLVVYGQRLRFPETSEMLFKKAGLGIKHKFGPKIMGPDIL